MKKILTQNVLKSWISTLAGVAILGVSIYMWASSRINSTEFTGLATLGCGLIGLNEAWLKGERP